MKKNNSLTTEFILIGITGHLELKIFLFLLFYAIYLVTMVGNLGLVVLIYMEHHLHKPMYFFLGNLALMDYCCSCAITPKMLENFFSVDTRISLYECMVQLYFLCLADTADCFLLAAMAYDRYVPSATHCSTTPRCPRSSPFRWPGAFIASNLHSMILVGCLLRLTFCKSNCIDHFFCDFLPLYRLSCTDPFINEPNDIYFFNASSSLYHYHSLDLLFLHSFHYFQDDIQGWERKSNFYLWIPFSFCVDILYLSFYVCWTTGRRK